MRLLLKTLILLAVQIQTYCAVIEESDKVSFLWKCENEKCKKFTATSSPSKEYTSFNVCMLFCGRSVMWPQPVHYNINGTPVKIKSYSIQLSETTKNNFISKNLESMISEAKAIFKQRIASKSDQTLNYLFKEGSCELNIQLQIKDTSQEVISLTTNESYTLTVIGDKKQVLVTIEGETYFGVRHGLETLAQLIVYDNIGNGSLVVPTYVTVEDSPHYPYRGIMLDTSRNYISVSSIKRTIDIMAANKLNRFHWHITDAQSFPLLLENFKQFAKHGAYSWKKVYTERDIKSLLRYALVRGIRIVPELNGPGHNSEGWQWTPSGTVVCSGLEPWIEYCNQPPCGQLNPLSQDMYTILGELYKDYIRLFDPDMFHMGSDDVNFKCWNSSEEIQAWIENYFINRVESTSYSEAYISLWRLFQEGALLKLREASVDVENKPAAVVWSSILTQGTNLKHLKNSDYIIQVRANRYDHTIYDLLEKDYRIILSNQDALSLDSGFGSFISEEVSMYSQWRKVYDFTPPRDLPEASEKMQLILGMEATLFTATTSEGSLDSKLWPRAAALAERVWTNPNTSWIDVESRILYHHERLQQLKTGSDAIEPEWCILNRGGCS